MFVDASVIVAVLAREDGHLEVLERLSGLQEQAFVSPLVRFEATTALARKKSGGRGPTTDLLERTRIAVETFLDELGAREVDISPEIGRAALDACARSLGVGLLYKGDGFARTDLA